MNDMIHCNPLQLLLLTAIVIFTTVAVYPQCPSTTSVGNHFRLVFPDSSGFPFTAQLVIMSDNISTAEVTIPRACCDNPPCVQTVFIAPNEPALITLDVGCAMHVRSGRSLKTIAVDVISGGPVGVLFKRGHEAGYSDDAYLALPIHTLDRLHNPLCYQGDIHTARWTAIPVEPQTIITYYDCDGSGPYDSPPLTTEMTFQHHCEAADMDCTGNPITGNYEFALVSGSVVSNIPSSLGASDTLMEMMMPIDTNAAGELQHYPITEFNKLHQSMPPGDIIRILTSGNNAEIWILSNGVITPDDSSGRPCPGESFTLPNAGDWCDMSIAGGADICAYGAPVQIAQYMKGTGSTGTGDPSMMQVISTNRYPCHHRFYSFSGYDYNPDTLDGSYVAIIAPYYALGSVRLDGVPLSIGCVGYEPRLLPGLYSWTQCRLRPGIEHTVDGIDNYGNDIGVMVYSYGQRQSGAYSYPAGIGFN